MVQAPAPQGIYEGMVGAAYVVQHQGCCIMEIHFMGFYMFLSNEFYAISNRSGYFFFVILGWNDPQIEEMGNRSVCGIIHMRLSRSGDYPKMDAS